MSLPCTSQHLLSNASREGFIDTQRHRRGALLFLAEVTMQSWRDFLKLSPAGNCGKAGPHISSVVPQEQLVTVDNGCLPALFIGMIQEEN